MRIGFTRRRGWAVVPPTDDEIREMAKARVSFRAHAAAYVIVNAFLVGLWWLSANGSPSMMSGVDGGYFWPIWSILGWGIGLAFHGYGAYGGGHGAIAREEQKLRERYGR